MKKIIRIECNNTKLIWMEANAYICKAYINIDISILNTINTMNPYSKSYLWAVITCDLLEVSIFYMLFCSSLDMTFMLWKYFWNLQVSGQTIPSWVLSTVHMIWQIFNITNSNKCYYIQQIYTKNKITVYEKFKN